MTAETLVGAVPPTTRWVPLVFTLALRDLRGGLSGFYVFLACIALGVSVIAGVGALSDALRTSFESQGQTLLGGDVVLTRIHVRGTDPERAWLTGKAGPGGTVSEVATLRSMARRADGAGQVLVEIKAVDSAYPLFGAVELDGGGALRDKIGSDHPLGAVVDPLLLSRLDLKPGDRFKVGAAEFVIEGVMKREPDQLGERIPYGPRITVSLNTLMRTGLVQPGSLIRWNYRVRLGQEAAADTFDRFRTDLKEALPEAGFQVADRRDPSPSVSRAIERLRQFLTLIGLTSLIVGGVGVANAVSTFIERKRRMIGTLKSLGASNRIVFQVFLIEVMLLAGLGVLMGLCLGYLLPLVVGNWLGDALPIALDLSFRPTSLMTAAVYGILVALVFMMWPLGRAELVRASVLFREDVAEENAWPRASIIAGSVALVALLIGIAVATSDAPKIALSFCLGVIAMFAIFAGLGRLVRKLAARLPRPRRPEFALALGNIGGPGSLTGATVLSLGTGLSLLVMVALANTSIVSEFGQRLPANAPTYYVLDITKAEWSGFSELIKREAPAARVDSAPMLRGRIVALKSQDVEKTKAPADAQWVLNGDRGLTFSEDVPEGSKVAAGIWWPKDYQGEPLVSFEVELARKLGLKIGDSVTVNVLGRNVTAKISNLREIKWENLSINFVMVFSPNTLKAAPYNLMATVTLPGGAVSGSGTDIKAEGRLLQRLATTYPTITAIRVKDAIDAFTAVFGKIMTAVQVAGGVTLISGALVLAGALATAQRRRIHQAVILKTLGATRRRILTSHVIEYLALALVTALIAAVIGTLAAWFIIVRIMELDFIFSGMAIFNAIAIAIGLVLTFGLAGTWRVLGARTVPYLRSE